MKLNSGKMFRRLSQLLFIFIGIICLSASYWQYQRGLTNQALSLGLSSVNRTGYHQSTGKELSDLGSEISHVLIDLQFDEMNPQFFLEPRYRDGVEGRELLTPYQADNMIIMVNRGWIAMQDSQVSEYVKKPPEQIQVKGYWLRYKKPINWLLNTQAELFYPNSLIRRIALYDLEYLKRFYQFPIASGILLAQSAKLMVAEKDRLLAPILTNHVAELPTPYPAYKNYGYSVQWLIFSFFAFGFFIRTVYLEKRNEKIK
ncbi:MAG: SURF1 family cytochrome oxidase biogenesis protein [Methylacidiphilales bacterium]|nr:SURF1 family cytochrome oxidase biogenesis protein [Candidatus Methylacidiphilales bacterium]